MTKEITTLTYQEAVEAASQAKPVIMVATDPETGKVVFKRAYRPSSVKAMVIFAETPKGLYEHFTNDPSFLAKRQAKIEACLEAGIQTPSKWTSCRKGELSYQVDAATCQPASRADRELYWASSKKEERAILKKREQTKKAAIQAKLAAPQLPE